MAVMDLSDWLVERANEGTFWIAKRLAGNDTLATESHQAGPYIPKALAFSIFPGLYRTDVRNPDVWLDAYVDSHMDHRQVRLVYYNNKFFGGSRNETRITNWGGTASAVLDPDATGALAVFVFAKEPTGATTLYVWVASGPAEEETIEERLGVIEPGHFLSWQPANAQGVQRVAPPQPSCRLTPNELPAAWRLAFPPASDIVRKSVELRPLNGAVADTRLVRRRDCEFELFRSIEEAIEGPRIRTGFPSLDEFVTHANSVLQRRKSRSGRSLELQLREIFVEEGLQEGRNFSHQRESEQGKVPDFLFPSADAYRDAAFPAANLRMLAAKTTCKDRWRQVLTEADRVQHKHLLTLQEGVSERQFAEMAAHHLTLVVPKANIDCFPKPVRPSLVTVEDFLASVRHLGRL